MPIITPLPLVRCRLDGSDDNCHVRFIPAPEFELWRHLMVTHHGREVSVEEVSFWLPESPSMLDDRIDPERLEPVLRVRFEREAPAGPGNVMPVVRFLPYETYPEARAALLGHFPERCQDSLEETPGYFVVGGESGDIDSPEQT